MISYPLSGINCQGLDWIEILIFSFFYLFLFLMSSRNSGVRSIHVKVFGLNIFRGTIAAIVLRIFILNNEAILAIFVCLHIWIVKEVVNVGIFPMIIAWVAHGIFSHA
jgi:hypothetical protein